MTTKGYSFQDDEKAIIYIDIDMDIVVEKEKMIECEKCTCIFFLK